MNASDPGGEKTTVIAELEPADWRRLNRLLEHALELEPAELESWLRSLQQESPHLVPLLGRLLGEPAGVRTEEFAAGPLVLGGLAGKVPPGADQIGDRVGPYRLLRLLGEGGMASVWLAERADGAMRREVALKIPHAEWADRGLADRISRECAVLAALSHPNIAHLYDAGWSESGRPYLALEVVQGDPIDRSCRNRGLDVRAKVSLFIEVLRAVAYAHARLVVHRDLKPANVLVTPAGQVKLLDFGIAKVLASESRTAEETELTRLAGRPLTLAYAAPEQVLGQAVTTATDIYSLGAMLYELLSGVRAYRPQRDTRGAIEEAIVRIEPPAPSAVAAARADVRALRGDLDTIILKALEKNPERRYETAAAMAEDLQRYLEGRPVQARRAGRLYRVHRFIARNRLAVAAAAAVTVALVVGLGVALWEAQREQVQAHNAQTINDFVLSLIQQSDPNASQQTKAADAALLKTFDERIDRELSGRPDLQLPLRLALATAYRNRNTVRSEEAAEVLRKAIAQARDSPSASPLDLLRARVLLGAASNASAERSQMLESAIPVLRKMGRPGIPLLVDALTARSETSQGADSAKSAIDAREAFELSRNALGPDDEHTLSSAMLLVRTIGPTGMHHNREALAAIEPVVRALKTSHRYAEGHPLALRVWSDYAGLLCWLGRPDEGIPILERNVRIAIEQHGDDRPTRIALLILAESQDAVGRIEDILQTNFSMYALVAARWPYATELRASYAYDVALVLILARRPLDAEPFIDEQIAFRKALPANEDAVGIKTDFQTGDNQLGSLMRLGEYQRAIQIGSALRDRFRKTHEATWVYEIDVWLGEALLAAGRVSEADAIAQEELAYERSNATPGISPTFGLAHAARARLAIGKPAEALALLDEAGPYYSTSIPRYEAAANADVSGWEVDRADAYVTRGRALIALGRVHDAVDPFRWAWQIWNGYAPDSHSARFAAYWYAKALDLDGQHEAAARQFDLTGKPPPEFPPADQALLRRERAKPPEQRIAEVMRKYPIRPEVAELIASLKAAASTPR